MAEKVTATDDGQGRKYWTQVPNIVLDLGLRPIPLALYLHLKRVAGDTSFSDETTRQLADRLECSPMAVSRALVELAEPREGLGGKALVKAARISDGKGARKPRIIVTIADIWPENMAKYGTPPVTIVDGAEGEAVNNSYGNGQSRNTMVRRRNIMVHPKEQEKPKELKDIAASTDDAADAADPAPPESLVVAGPTDPNGTADLPSRNGTGTPNVVEVTPAAAGKVSQADIRGMVEAMAAARGYPPANFARHTRAAKRLIKLGHTPGDVTRTVAYIRRECAHLNGQPLTMETVSKYIGIAAPLRLAPTPGTERPAPDWLAA